MSQGQVGRPSKQCLSTIRAINQDLFQAALCDQPLPSDRELAQRYELSDRTVRTIRLQKLGLNRRQLQHWQAQVPSASASAASLVCETPFAGLWLLVPQVLQAGWVQAAQGLQSLRGTRVQALQVILTCVAWAALGFQRLFHIDDFRHPSDVGLALFTGRWRLWSDSSLWGFLHGLSLSQVQTFYQSLCGPTARQPASQGRISLDEHVVASFSQRKPPPLRKNRIPTRGRSYPAFRLYLGYDLDLGRFVALLVRRAQQALSQVLPDLLAEVRQVRQKAQVPKAEWVRLIFDRGGYKGGLFAKLMGDEQVSFIAMARATQKNVRQWTAIPEQDFWPYQPQDSLPAQLRIALSQTQVSDCPQPIPSVVIRDDAPDTKQRWRVLFFKQVEGHNAQPEAIDAEYRQRQEHELGFRQFVHHLAGHCLPKAYQMIRVANAKGEKRTTLATVEAPETQPALLLIAWIKFLTYNLIRDFGQALGKQQAAWEVATLVRRYLRRPGRLYLDGQFLIVQLDPFQGDADLLAYIAQVNQCQFAIPWFDNRILRIELASQAQGLAGNPQLLRKLIFANSGSNDP